MAALDGAGLLVEQVGAGVVAVVVAAYACWAIWKPFRPPDEPLKSPLAGREAAPAESTRGPRSG